MSSDSGSGFIGSILEFLFLIFLVWMMCSPKKEPFIELTVDNHKIELFGESIIKIHGDEKLHVNAKDSYSTLFDSINENLSDGWNYAKITKPAKRIKLVKDSLGLKRVQSSGETDWIVTVRDSSDEDTADITKKPIEPIPEEDYGRIEEFEYTVPDNYQ